MLLLLFFSFVVILFVAYPIMNPIPSPSIIPYVMYGLCVASSPAFCMYPQYAFHCSGPQLICGIVALNSVMFGIS